MDLEELLNALPLASLVDISEDYKKQLIEAKSNRADNSVIVEMQKAIQAIQKAIIEKRADNSR